MNTASMDHAPVRVVAPILFGSDYVVGALLQWWRPLPVFGSPMRWIAGVLLALPALALGAWSLANMHRAGTSPNPHQASKVLVEAGPYRVTRNPMYLSMVLVCAGLACAFRATWAVVLLPVAAWLVNRWVIAPEERYLTERFGDAYTAYRARVRRWI